ncbi:hypothetical protein SAMN04244548_03009 [Paracoccus pantotrophus]|nr:hypothetical protein SAMN04244548_03009 [Paracoccus pantotrophus]
MTVEIFEPAPIYQIQNAGPFAIPHPYETGAIRVAVIEDGQVMDLDPADFTVAPPSGAGGTVSLAPAIATAHRGARLTIWRETPEEQGWLGVLGERERGLEVQLDRIVMAIQEQREIGRRSLRATVPIAPFDPVDGRAIIFQDGNPAPGPAASDIANAQDYAERAEQAARQAEEAAQGMILSYPSRAALAEALPDLVDGTTVLAGGQPYVIDSAAMGYDSALHDLGVDGARRADRLENLFIAAHFTTQDDTTIHISASLDGVHFSVINTAVLPGGQGFDLSQRDPSITWYAGRWWIFGTGGSAGNHDFVCFRSQDLTNWSKFQIAMQGGPYFSNTTPMPGGVSPASAIWAPEPFIEAGVMHVMVSIRYGADFTNLYGATQQHFRPYVTTLTDPVALAFSAPVPMIFGPGDHTDGDSRIDPSVVKHAGVYYCAIKDSYYRRIQLYYAEDLTGPYTFDQVLSGGTLEIEAPCLVRIRDRSAINSEARRDKWRVYVDNNRTGVGDPDPNSLVGAPYYFEAVGAPDATYGAMQKCYFDTPVRHGSIVNLSELPPEASRALSNVAAASGQKRRNLGRQVELGSGSQWIRPQQDVLYYASVNSGAVTLQLRDGPADRFYLGAMSAQAAVGILVQGSGFSPRQFLIGFGRGNDAVIEMRRRQDGQYYPVGLVRRSEFRAHRNGSNQSFTAGTDTAVVWTTETYDAGDNFDTGTGRWTPPRGRLDIEAQVTITDGESSGTLRVDILKNGSAIVATGYAQGSGQFAARAVLRGEEATGTDYYSVQVRATGSGSRTLNGNAYLTNFYGVAW